LAAQVWYEWRRCGVVLPALVGSLLVAVIGPLSWFRRNDPKTSTLILIVTVAMPVILALPIGKAFSKPDLWLRDLSVPPMVAVRPLDDTDLVVAKMKVAARSAAISWAFVLMFLSLWLPVWANLDGIKAVRNAVWQISGRSMYPQYEVEVLGIFAAILLTWALLIRSFWLGLGGNTRLFVVSTIPYPFFIVLGLLVILVQKNQQSILTWIQQNLNSELPRLQWLAVVLVVGKALAAIFSWRRIPAQRAWTYLSVWAGSTLIFVAFAISLWTVIWPLVSADVYGLRNLMILVALMPMPLARIAIAPSAFARNRHRR